MSNTIHEQYSTQSQFFKQGSTGLNSEISFSKTIDWIGDFLLQVAIPRLKKPSLLYHPRIAGGRITG